MASGRVVVDGKHLTLNGRPFQVRGATYGGFLPRMDGEPFPERWQIKNDLSEMESVGLNTVRTYSVPPPELIDLAEELGRRVMVGLHYDDWRMEPQPSRRARRRVLDAGRRAVDEAMELCAGRTGVLAVVVGNEVPADLVRVHGAAAVEDTLAQLIAEVHAADPGMLATYCNFPTTEYLDIEGQDLVCFNVFLEEPGALRRYLRRLQITSGNRPLVITELGLAAGTHGSERQAEALAWMLEAVDETGCAGAIVFSWTDEWGVAGESVDGWGFGITDRDRTPKPAFEVVRRWSGSSLADLRERWPRLSAVVCAYNGDHLIHKCLASLQACNYPDLEVIVCDDGSTDDTLEIARRFPFKVIALERGGLAAARNAGIATATGEIVAFIDADAYCHPEWPFHLALSLEGEGVAATGGPNLPVPGVGLVERAVGHSPGGPVHVLVADDRAEHVPGCNMAFRKDALEEVGGFDPAYTAAGDDVDVCWKLLDRGHEIAFAPAAQVFHHRRDTVRGYLRQQRGYGRAERLVARSHPHRFNRLGQARWSGFIYAGLRPLRKLLRPVVYHGPMGLAPYQGVVHRTQEQALSGAAALLPLAVPIALAGPALSSLSLKWFALPAAMALVVAAYALAVARGVPVDRREPQPMALRALVAALHTVQPLVRAWGRLRGTRKRAPNQSVGTDKRTLRHRDDAPTRSWDGDRTAWLDDLARALARRRCRVRTGGPHDPWDLKVAVGPLVTCRVTTAITWGWNPVYKLALRPRPVAYASIGAVATLGVALSPTLWGAGIAVAAAGALEATLLSGITRSALRETTAGARHGAREGGAQA